MRRSLARLEIEVVVGLSERVGGRGLGQPPVRSRLMIDLILARGELVPVQQR